MSLNGYTYKIEIEKINEEIYFEGKNYVKNIFNLNLVKYSIYTEWEEKIDSKMLIYKTVEKNEAVSSKYILEKMIPVFERMII